MGTVNYMVWCLEEKTEQGKLTWGPQWYPNTTVENQAEREMQGEPARRPRRGGVSS